MGTVPEDLCTFIIVSCRILLRMRIVADKSSDKIKTHVLRSVTFSENCAVYEIMCKNIVEPDRPQMTI